MKTKSFLLAVAFAAMAFTFSCSPGVGDDGDGGSSSSGGGQGGSSSSSVDGGASSSSNGTPNSLATVTIGSQVWMAKNLDSDVPGSKCYGDDPANCTKYGRLYDWATAMGLPSSCNSSSCSSSIQSKHRGICPSGWHIPSNDDWDKLFRWVDGQNNGEGSGEESPYHSYTAGKYLKATSGWNENGNDTDKYGFSALPGGRGYSGGDFINAGYFGLWWSSGEYVSYGAYSRYMGYKFESADWGLDGKSVLYSVRCVQD